MSLSHIRSMGDGLLSNLSAIDFDVEGDYKTLYRDLTSQSMLWHGLNTS